MCCYEMADSERNKGQHGAFVFLQRLKMMPSPAKMRLAKRVSLPCSAVAGRQARANEESYQTFPPTNRRRRWPQRARV